MLALDQPWLVAHWSTQRPGLLCPQFGTKIKSIWSLSGVMLKMWLPYWDLPAGRVRARKGRSFWCRWWRWWGRRCCGGLKPSAGSEASRTSHGLSSHPASAGTFAPAGERRYLLEQLRNSWFEWETAGDVSGIYRIKVKSAHNPFPNFATLSYNAI